MKLLADFFPVVAFYVAYKLSDIYIATAVILVAVLLQTAFQWWRHRKLNPMVITSAVLVMVFGGLTLLVHDKTFFQWKPTVVNWLFAVAFLCSHFIGQQPLIQRMLSTQVTLPRSLWLKLNALWTGFFTLMGALNLYVVYHFDEKTWVDFKLFGMLGLTLVFIILQGLWLATKVPAEPAQ